LADPYLIAQWYEKERLIISWKLYHQIYA